MTPVMTDSMFPYGTFPVDPAFAERYAQDYSHARYYSLPDRLPYHHPLLSRLEGIYPLKYVLPPWWHARITQMEPSLLKPLLATISPQEFRAGCIEQTRWKAFRESLSEKERRQLPNSPKVAALLEGTDWSANFWNRGSTDTPDQCNLVISTHPLDFLYMSNGHEWRSCQHFRDGGENQHLPGNFYDTGVAVAMALPPNTNVTDPASVLARTTLRVFRSQEQTVVALGRTYHNNETLAFLLLCKLADLFDSRRLSWGFMTDVNTLYYCQESSLGPELHQRIDKEVFVEGEPCWLPSGWYAPYVDGGDRQWERSWERACDEYYQTQLSASIKLMRPRTLPQVPAQTHFTLARLASAGVLPHFL